MANPLAITKRNDLPTTLCTILNYVNPVLNPSTDTIVCVLLIMPVAGATAERSSSVVRYMKTYVRSTMKNDGLSSLGLMHLHRDFEHVGQILNNFKKFMSIKVIKIVLDFMLYETLKWPQIAPFCISSKIFRGRADPDPLPFKIMVCTLLSLSYAPVNRSHIGQIKEGKAQIICRLRNWKDKNLVHLKTNETRIFITEDLTKTRQNLVKTLNTRKKAK